MVSSAVTLRTLRNVVALAIIVSLGALSMTTTDAEARNSLKRWEGKIAISKERFPSRFDSDEAMARHMRRVNTHEIFAEEGKEWQFEYMAFLPRPVATLQASVSFFDITVPGTERLINTYVFYPNNRSDKVLNGEARLSRNQFEPNRKYLMVFSRGYGQPALAQTKVVLRDQ